MLLGAGALAGLLVGGVGGRLAIGLFVLIPGVYAVTLSLLAERWLGPRPPLPGGRAGQAVGWVARAALAVLFVVSLVSLVDKTRVLT